jgi:hypothetical protein
VEGRADLLEVVLALHPCGGLPHLLDRGQQKADQHRDARDHHEQFEQREPEWARKKARSAHG